MSGVGGDPRLFEAAWANEARIAAGGGEAAEARKHGAEDRDAAVERLRVGTARRRSLWARLLGLVRGR